jgi:hypothetical protein
MNQLFILPIRGQLGSSVSQNLTWQLNIPQLQVSTYWPASVCHVCSLRGTGYPSFRPFSICPMLQQRPMPNAARTEGPQREGMFHDARTKDEWLSSCFEFRISVDAEGYQLTDGFFMFFFHHFSKSSMLFSTRFPDWNRASPPLDSAIRKGRTWGEGPQENVDSLPGLPLNSPDLARLQGWCSFSIFLNHSCAMAQ